MQKTRAVLRSHGQHAEGFHVCEPDQLAGLGAVPDVVAVPVHEQIGRGAVDELEPLPRDRLPMLGRDALAHDPTGDRHELVVHVRDALGVDLLADLRDGLLPTGLRDERLEVSRHLGLPSVLGLRLPSSRMPRTRTRARVSSARRQPSAERLPPLAMRPHALPSSEVCAFDHISAFAARTPEPAHPRCTPAQLTCCEARRTVAAHVRPAQPREGEVATMVRAAEQRRPTITDAAGRPPDPPRPTSERTSTRSSRRSARVRTSRPSFGASFDSRPQATGCHACLIWFVEGERLVLRSSSAPYEHLAGVVSMDSDRGPRRLGGQDTALRVHQGAGPRGSAGEVLPGVRGGAVPVARIRTDVRSRRRASWG